MTERRDIELVVFDMDGVLVHLDRRRRLDLLSEMTGRDRAFLHEAIWASDFEPGAESGAYPTGAEYLAEFNRRAQTRLSRQQWVRARREATTPEREALRIAQAVRRYCRIAMLTNNGSLLHESLPDVLPDVSRVFGEHAYASFQFNARKPQREVFERLLGRCEVEPERAIFIDDSEEFVEGARRAGMQGIVYAGPADLRRRLSAFGLGAAPRPA